MTEPIDIEEMMQRIAALESEALAYMDSDYAEEAIAYPFSLKQQAVYPYLTNQLAPWTMEDESQDINEYNFAVTGRLLIAAASSGVDGETERKTYHWLAQIIHYINEHEALQSEAYPTPMDGIDYARCRLGTGITRFNFSGLGPMIDEWGTAFTVEIRLYNPICQKSP